MSGAPLGHTAGTDGPNLTLSVFADLDVDVDGRSARLAGNGQHLVLTSDDPAHLWDTLTRASLPSGIGQVSGPRAVGRAASLLSDNGLTLDIVGPRGPVVRLGADAHSWAGRLLTGSEAVQPSSVRAVLPVGVRLGSRLAEGIGGRLARQRISDPARPDCSARTPAHKAAPVAAGAGLLAVLVVVIRRLHRSRNVSR